jgi:DNA-binding PadR family transcriptional regulator
MSTFSSGDITPRMMVLGLVIQQSDSIAGVGRRLADQFASARFPRGAAHKNLPSLAIQGYVRLVDSGAPGGSTLDRYEATEEGVEHFRAWLRRTEFPPAIRDALQGKLEFLEREDLAALVRIVNDEGEAYAAAFNLAQANVLQEQSVRRRTREAPVDWRVRLRGIRNRDEATLWGLMSQRLERLREDLEELMGEISDDETAPDG